MVRTLNDPLPIDDDSPEWTPTRGLIRATVRGGIATALFIGLSAPVAAYVPLLLFHFWARLGIAFVVTSVLFHVVQSAAGMVSGRCTALAATCTMIVLLSHNVLVAVLAGPDPGPWIAYCHPLVLALSNWAPAGLVALCGWYYHANGVELGFITDILNTRPLG